MTRVTQDAEERNAIPSVNSSDFTASTKSTFDDSASARSGGEEKDKTWMLSRELALFINPEQADLTASLLIYGLYTWQVSKRNSFGYNPKIDGRLCCYRSLRELEESYPWLKHNSILKALRRAAKALKGEFTIQVVKRNGQKLLHFLLSEKLIKRYKFDLSVPYAKDGPKGRETIRYWKRRKSGLLSFQRNDAIAYGLFEAILISNLVYVLDPAHNAQPLLDDAGNIYRELSPAKLTQSTGKDDPLPPLPVSPDTVIRALNKLKQPGLKPAVFHEHPLQNNFYTLVATMKPLVVDAAEVNTIAAEVNTPAAEVTSKTEVELCNVQQMNDVRQLFESLDSNRDRNADGKCVRQQTSSLRSDVPCGDEQMSEGAKKMMQLVNEGLAAFRQRGKAGVPRFNVVDHAVYWVDDYDSVSIIGYEFDHEFVVADWQTGKPYSRELELSNYMEECERFFCLQQLSCKDADKVKLRQLFEDHPHFTPDTVHDLVCHDYLFGIPKKPKKGHDFDFFTRKLTSVEYLLRYLPQLIREKYLNSEKDVEWAYHPVTKQPMFDYSGLDANLLPLAFADGKTPVYWAHLTLHEERPEVGCYLEDGKYRDFLTGGTTKVATTRVKPIYYDEFTSAEYDYAFYESTAKPGSRRYEEFVALPLLNEEIPEPKDFDSVAMKKWKCEHGQPVHL